MKLQGPLVTSAVTALVRDLIDKDLWAKLALLNLDQNLVQFFLWSCPPPGEILADKGIEYNAEWP